MNIKQILEHKGTQCHTISSDRTLKDAVSMMMQHRVGSLLVVDHGRLVSIVTERDVLWAVNQHGGRVTEVKIAEIMAKDLVTCHGGCSLADAMDLMTKRDSGRRIRHLPVVDPDGNLEGIISIGDIVNTLIRETEFENKLLRNYIRNWPEAEA